MAESPSSTAVIADVDPDVTDIVTDAISNVVIDKVPDFVDEIFETLLQKLRFKIGNLEINGRSIMVFMRYAMEIVEVTQLKGEEQKQMVLRLLERVVRDAPISDKKEALCLKLINGGTVGQTIDIVVDATRGNLDINSIANAAVGAMVSTGCCGLFK